MRRSIRLLTSESRLSRQEEGGQDWLIGASLVDNQSLGGEASAEEQQGRAALAFRFGLQMGS